jgi:flagellar protein FliO/FliZ
MMLEYFLRLAILLPLLGGLIWGSLWMWRRVQMGLPVQPARDRAARVVDVVPMGAGTKLAVIRFDNRDVLIAIARGQVSLLSQSNSLSRSSEEAIDV